MTPYTLVRHPAPFETESLTGYMLRLSEVNGYMSPWSICQLAGLRQSEIRSTGIPVAKLAAILNRPVSELERIAFVPPPGKPRWATLLSQPVLPTELNVTNPLFCPQCVSERGFIEAHWHLRLMVACPIHLTSCPSMCPTCRKTLRWFRPGLLECQCGASLLGGAPNPRMGVDLTLLSLIKTKILGDRCRPVNAARLPLNDLIAMDLRALIAVIRALGRLRITANGGEAGDDQLEVVVAATEVLSSWPANFFSLITALGERGLPKQRGAVGKQFASFYHSLFKSKTIGKEQSDFLRSAFVEFATNHWGRGFVDRKLTKHVSKPGNRRFMTVAEFAATVGVQPRTAIRLLETTRLTAERVKCGKAARIIVDTSVETVSAKKSGRILRMRAAARMLGLPVTTLKLLKESGVFEVKHLPPTYPGWHERDVQAFCAKLLGAANPEAARENTNTISLRRIMDNRHLPPGSKAELIQRVLAGHFVVSASAGSGIDGIRLDLQTYRRFLLDVRARTAGDTQSPTEVAATLHCDPGTIPKLLDMKRLTGYRTPTGLRISPESVARFATEYSPLVLHARSLRTSTRALMRVCEETGIGLLLVPVAGRRCAQPFVRNVDAGAIRSRLAARGRT